MDHWLQLLLLALLLANAYAQIRVELAEIYPFSTTQPDFNVAIAAVHDAHLLGIQHAQEDGFLPGTTISLRQYDTTGITESSDEQTAVFAALDAYRHGVSGILGPALSSVAKNVALVTRPLQLPVCSAFAAAVALSDKSQFPYFYRFMVTAATVGRTTSLFLEKYGWNRFTIVIDSESTYSSDVASVLVSSAAIAGQNVLANLIIYPSTVQPLSFATVYNSLIATNSGVLVLITISELGPDLLKDLNRRGWFSSAPPGHPRIVITANNPVLNLFLSSPQDAIDIIETAVLINSGNNIADSPVLLQFIADYQARTGQMYPLHENSGDSNFLMGYACAYTMVVGLHRLAATAGTSITAVASHDPATWSHMSLSLFNLTAAVFPRPRDMITLDSNGDGIAGPMAMTQYAFNRDPTNSSVITALDPVNCDVYPFEMRLTYASSLVPCVFPGMRTGEIPSDTPTVATVTLINPRVGDSAGNAILSLCGSALALLLISCTGMVHFRKHPALSLTPWPGIVAMHLIAAATPVSAFLDLFPLTPLICSSQMTLTAAPVTCTLVVFYVQAKAVAQAIECQHRIPTEQGRIVASPSSLSVPSFGFTRSIMSATRSIRPISKTALSQESVVPPRTPQQELLYHFAAVDGSQGVTPYLRAMVQHGFPIFIVYMTLLSISIGLCQPTTSMVSLSATTANMSCTCKNGERIYWQTSVYLAHTVFMFLVARLVYQHRSVHFNNKLMLRIGASIVNMVIFVGLILVFYYFPSTAWLYVFMAFLRIYCGISTVGIYLIPLCVNIYTSSKAEVFTATSSNDSLYECVQQIRSELENERRPSVIPKSVPDGDGDATIAAVAAAPRAPLSRKISGMSVRIGVPATVMTSRLALASPTAAAAPSNANTVRSQQQLVLTSVDGGPSGDPLIAVEEMPAEEAASTSTGTVYFNVKVSAALPAASQLLLSLRDPIWHAFRSYAGNGLLGAITPRLRALSSRSRDPQRRWSNAYVVVVGGPTRAEMRLIYIGEQPNGDGDRIAGPPESFDLVLYSESQSKSSPLTPQSEVSNSSSTTLLGLLHCRESHRFVALKFASKDQLQEFCLIVPPRAAHEQGSMMSIF